MKTKAVINISLAIALGCALLWALTFKQGTPQANAPGEAVKAAAKPAVVVAPDNPPLANGKGKAAADPALPPVETSTPKNGTKPSNTAPTESSLKINGYEVLDPMARLSLNLVGSDPDAEAYWVGAINDSALPPEERKDLIEDLNEDGLSDPHHPTAEDMPLIMRRIQLIEQLAPNALDDVNRAAFAEAHKDLVGLLNGQEPQ